MTKSEVLAFVQEIKPHEFGEAVMCRWLDELEGKIACEIHGKAACNPHAGLFSAETLSVPAPYDRLYWQYLVSMLDLAAGNYEAFEVSDRNFKEAYAEYARYVQRHGGFGQGKRRFLR